MSESQQSGGLSLMRPAGGIHRGGSFMSGHIRGEKVRTGRGELMQRRIHHSMLRDGHGERVEEICLLGNRGQATSVSEDLPE